MSFLPWLDQNSNCANGKESLNHSFILNSAFNACHKGNKTLPWFYRSSHFSGGYRMTEIYIIWVHFDEFKSRMLNKVEGVTLSETFRRGSFMAWLLDIENEKKKRWEKVSLKITPKLGRTGNNVVSEKFWEIEIRWLHLNNWI